MRGRGNLVVECQKSRSLFPLSNPTPSSGVDLVGQSSSSPLQDLLFINAHQRR